MPSFNIITYGCQMNKYDSDVVTSMLLKKGWVLEEDPNIADLVLINTCSVRQNAENRALGRAQSLACGKKPNQKVGIMGCMAQRLKEQLFEEIPMLDFVIGTDNIEVIPSLLENAKQQCYTDLTSYTGEGNFSVNEDNTDISAFVAISRGCSNFCSYCIVPYVRGPLRSRVREDILKEIKHHVDNGIVEITLLGQNVNSYDYNGTDFSDLLLLVADIEEVKRIRFTTNHPKDFSKKLIDVMATNPKIAPSIHLPAQSGSSKVLKLMNRKYDRENYLEKVKYLYSQIPHISISSDILVGYPGETEQDYQETVSLINEVKFSGLFSFKYSVRPGTASSNIEDSIPEEKKLARLQQIIDLGQKYAKEYSLSHIGHTVEVLVEGMSHKDPSKFRGRAGNGRIVEFTSDKEHLRGELCFVKVDSCTTWTLTGIVE